MDPEVEMPESIEEKSTRIALANPFLDALDEAQAKSTRSNGSKIEPPADDPSDTAESDAPLGEVETAENEATDTTELAETPETDVETAEDDATDTTQIEVDEAADPIEPTPEAEVETAEDDATDTPETETAAEPDEEEQTEASRTKTPIPLRNKLLAAGGLLGAVFALFVLFALMGTSEADQPSGVPLAAIGQTDSVDEPPPNTLGIHLDEVRGAWNSLEQQPLIASPLRRLSEPGALDSFLHRFDGTAEIIGAYQDESEYLVALMARFSLRRDDAANVYLHLCHTLHPFTPGCIDSYHKIGLDGKAFEEFTADDVETTWEFEGNTWRLTSAGGDLTIRVLAPDG